MLAASEAAGLCSAAMLRMFTAEMDAFNVEFAGYLIEPGLAACFAAADVVANVSRQEGFYRPLLTAILCDAPVAAQRARIAVLQSRDAPANLACYLANAGVAAGAPYPGAGKTGGAAS